MEEGNKQEIDILCEPSLDEKEIRITLTSKKPIDAVAMVDSLAHFIEVYCNDNGIYAEDQIMKEEPGDFIVPKESKH